MSAPVAILAGGLATRLGSAASGVPKALVEVAGKPFIAHQLELLRRRGVERVLLCVGHLGSVIEKAVGDGGRWGLQVEYAHDGPRLLGTGGALRRAWPRLGPSFFVLYGDSYLEFDYDAVWRAFEASGLPALMTVFRNDGRWGASNVLYEGGRIVRYDKRAPAPEMRHIDYGLGILAREALAAIPEGGPYDLADLYARLAAEGRLAAYEATERFYEIGTPDGLRELRALLESRRK